MYRLKFLKYFFTNWQKLPSGYVVTFCFLIFFLLGISIHFTLNLVDYYYSVVYKSPVKWQGINISLPKGTKYSFDESFINGVSRSSVKFERYFSSSPVGYGNLYSDYGDESLAEENLFFVYAGEPITSATLFVDYFPEGIKEKMMKRFRNLEIHFLNDPNVVSVVSHINDEFFEITAIEPYNLVYDLIVYKKCYPNFCFFYYGEYENKRHFKSIMEDVENKLIGK